MQLSANRGLLCVAWRAALALNIMLVMSVSCTSTQNLREEHRAGHKSPGLDIGRAEVKAALALVDHGAEITWDRTSTPPHVVKVRFLNIVGKRPEALAPLRELPFLRELELCRDRISDENLREIIQPLGSERITDKGPAQIKGLKRLRSITVRGPGVTEAGLKCLRELPGLQTLNLYSMVVSDETLAEISHLRELGTLRITYSAGSGEWRQLGNLRSLTELSVRCKVAIPDKVLASIAGLPNLVRLDLIPLSRDGSAEGLKGKLRGFNRLKFLRLSLAARRGAEQNLAWLADLAEVEVLELSRATVSARDVQAISRMPKLRELYMICTFDGDAAKHLAGPRTLQKLSLWAGGREVDLTGIEKMVGLRSLSISLSGIPGFWPSCDLPALGRLKNLQEFHFNGPAGHITDVELQAIGQLVPLRKLSLNTEIKGPHGKGLNLMGLSGLSSLEQLDLGTCLEGGLQLPVALAPTLRSLDLSGTSISYADLAALGEFAGLEVLTIPATCDSSPRAPGLLDEVLGRSLRIETTNSGLAFLTKLTSLEALDLSMRWIGDEGMKRLKGLDRLKTLDLSYTCIGDAGLANLRKAALLEELNLGGTRITGTGLKYLAGLRKLRVINLADTEITNAGLVHLGQLKSLEEIDLGRAERVTDTAIRRLRTALPYTRVLTWGRKSGDIREQDGVKPVVDDSLRARGTGTRLKKTQEKKKHPTTAPTQPAKGS